MDFLDSLKDIKKQMQNDVKKEEKSDNEDELKQIFLKEKKLRDEFSEFIASEDIKKI
ncbi:MULTISPECIES: hypothetical protein [unclassified Campylobacter]|uniref:hypothetical protein n=1 Tax=unclassified Campylobacter TaxID=2593542 RepID=UPI001382FB55|nr:MULTISPECIES: hypothetical protein [unclassified Campylobacter]KAA8604001.1 hypothetical protein CGP82_05015 [Campylobacter sp. LR185c]